MIFESMKKQNTKKQEKETIIMQKIFIQLCMKK
jgi:hypothetical protein